MRLVNKIMGKKSDPRDFLLNTDYEMDKIVYFEQGEISEGQTITLPHKLGFAPLVFGICSFNSDYSDARSIPYQKQTQDELIDFQIFATTSDVQITYVNYADNPPKMYYRIYAFEPADSHAKIGATSKYAKQFILNTDYNYCKLWKKGISVGNETITHNFGYLPQVMAWQEANGGITPLEYSLLNDPWGNTPTYAKITTTTVEFTNLGRLHYRIYYDEV